MEFNDIEENIRQKYSDAVTLKNNNGFANSIYLSGYCVELALKYAIAKHMGWEKFYSKGDRFKFLKVHDLNFLVLLTGKMQIKNLPEWQIVTKWDEKKRYSDPKKSTESNANDMLVAVKKLVEDLCEISL